VHGWPWGPRGLFKTFAWQLSAAGLGRLEASASAAAAGAGGVPSAACETCEPHCYDHLVEWAARGSRVLVAAAPRASQDADRGMSCPDPTDPACTYQRGNAIPAMHGGECVSRVEFVLAPLEAAAWTPWLPGPSVTAATRGWVAAHGGRALAWALIATREPFIRAGAAGVGALVGLAGALLWGWWRRRRRGAGGGGACLLSVGAVATTLPCGGGGGGGSKND
jgi:hypothetical protein